MPLPVWPVLHPKLHDASTLFPWQSFCDLQKLLVLQRIWSSVVVRFHGWLTSKMLVNLYGTSRRKKIQFHLEERNSPLWLFDKLRFNCRVWWMFWEQKTPGASAIESQSQEEEALTLFSSVFPLSALPPSVQKRIHEQNVMFILESEAMPRMTRISLLWLRLYF